MKAYSGKKKNQLDLSVCILSNCSGWQQSAVEGWSVLPLFFMRKDISWLQT